MHNPVRAGTHPSKAHLDSHPLSDEHRRATRTSRVTVHPQQSTVSPADLGTKHDILVKGSGSIGASPVCPTPVPINHFWKVVGEAAANDSFAAEWRKSPFNPACCCLSP